MNDQRHDYSRHSVHELEHETYSLDPAKYPERAKSLQAELLKRLHVASDAAAQVATSKAVAVGAQYAQLDNGSARGFFWRFLGVSFVFSFTAGLLVAIVASLVEGVFAAFGVGSAGSITGQVIRVITSLILAVPVADMWLKIFTKHSFGGFGMRLVAVEPRDAA